MYKFIIILTNFKSISLRESVANNYTILRKYIELITQIDCYKNKIVENKRYTGIE